jgi:hypothetical protein
VTQACTQAAVRVMLPLLLLLLDHVAIPSAAQAWTATENPTQGCPATLPPAANDVAESFFRGFSPIKYGGPASKSPLAFRYYNAGEEICALGRCKTMKEW